VRAASALFLLAASLACAEPQLPVELEGVGVSENLGRHVDPNLTFTAENGYPVRLGDLLNHGRPVILNLVYYSCPMLCTLVLNGQAEALRQIPGTAGKDFDIVTISIDARDTFDLAQKKRASYLTHYGRDGATWRFLVDRDGNAKKLAEQAGFHYRYDESIQQFAHPAAIMILTPEGKMARYLYGIHFNPRDVRLALAEASHSRFTLSTDRVLLFCFHYDPQARGYVLFATNFMRAVGALMVFILGGVLIRLWRQEAR
jgi:protein SCO1